MANWLVAFAIDKFEDGCHWRVVTDNGEVLSSGASHFSELVDATYDKLALILPGQDIVAVRAILTAKNDAQLRATAPFVIEDDIGAEIDSQHVSIGYHAPATRHYTAAVISHDAMKQWQTSLKDAGLFIDKILPEYLCLPKNEECITEANVEDRKLYRFKDWGCGFDIETDFELTQSAVRASINKWELDEKPDLLEFCQVQQESKDILNILALRAVKEPFSLLQGEYAVKATQASSGGKGWKTPLLLAAASLAFASVYNYAEGLTLKSETQVLSTSIAKDIKRVFPEVKRIVNARAQLKELTAGTGQASDFLQLSGLLSAGVQEVKGIVLDSLRYDARRNEIQASITYATYEELTLFKTTIEALGGSVREGGSRQVGNMRSGEITVTL